MIPTIILWESEPAHGRLYAALVRLLLANQTPGPDYFCPLHSNFLLMAPAIRLHKWHCPIAFTKYVICVFGTCASCTPFVCRRQILNVHNAHLIFLTLATATDLRLFSLRIFPPLSPPFSPPFSPFPPPFSPLSPLFKAGLVCGGYYDTGTGRFI